jgi:hypothetical protein
MRQYLIISWIHLILSVINFALAAPLVIRERPEVRVGVVDATKDGTAAPQTLSRWGPWDAWSGSNEKDWKNAPPGPDSESSGESDPEPGSNSPLLESASNFVNRPSEYSSDSDIPYSTSSDYPHSASSDVPYSTGSEIHYSTGFDYSHSASSDIPYSTGSEIPYSTGSDYSHSASSDVPYSTGSEINSWDQMPTNAPASSLSTGHSPPQSPGQTDNYLPPGLPSNPGRSTGPQRPQQSTDGLTPASPEPQSPAEPESENFLSKLLKGKIKRRTSGSRTVYTAQREFQDTLDSRAYVHTLRHLESINILT